MRHLKAERALDAQQAHIMNLTAAGATGHSGGVEDEGMMAQLGATITHLQQQLEDERESVAQIKAECQAYAAMVDEKEALLHEAGMLMQEAQSHFVREKERADALQNEAFSAAGEVEGLREQLKTELEKAFFDIEEMKATQERLQTENERMVRELAELSGESAPEGSRRERTNMEAGISMEMDNTPQITSSNNNTQKDIDSNGTLSPLSPEDIESLSLDGRHAAAEEARNNLMLMLQRLGVTGDLHITLINWSDQLLCEQEKWFKKAEDQFAQHDRSIAEHNKKLREMEVQRSRLEKDLQFRTEKYMQLQSDMDNLRGMDGQPAAEFLADRERAHMRSLQQRLEQLVAVHRQLLRKFASLELENSELRKKISLRDERIRQLEHNSRALTANMRSQAERHISELTNLRDQIQNLRLEHQQKLDTKAVDSSAGHHQRHEGPRTVRGGQNSGGASGSSNNQSNEPRSLRGGGAKPAVPSPDNAKQQSGLFSRLLGPKV
eukprot:gene4457-8880_t